MKVQEAIDKINAIEGWTAHDLHCLGIDHTTLKLNVFAPRHNEAALWCFPELVPMPIYMDFSQLQDDDYFDSFYKVMSILHDLKKTKLSNRGIKVQKYTVQILPSENGYLDLDKDADELIVSSDVVLSCEFKTRFTKQEIDELKERDDLAIDWYKAKIEPVEDDE